MLFPAGIPCHQERSVAMLLLTYWDTTYINLKLLQFTIGGVLQTNA